MEKTTKKKLVRLTLFLCLILTIGIVNINAQTQSVCAGSTKIYDINPNVGSTYYWSLKNGLGTITNISGRSDSIIINYGTVTGTDTLRVVEVGSSGCKGDTAKIRILILQNLTATISGTDSICTNNASVNRINVAFTGAGPWNLSYTDGTTPVTVNNISTNPYLITSPVYSTVGIRTFTITSISAANSCPAVISGTGSVRVFAKPSTITINTY
jgi:hypothetical protein